LKQNVLVFTGKAGQPSLYISDNENEVVWPRDKVIKLLGIREVDDVTREYGGDVGKNIRFLLCKFIE
jgi:hypothetical protein